MFAVVEESLVSALILSLVPMGAIAVVAGLTAMLQAMTQVQEQSISHLARLVAISVVLVWGGQRAFGEIERMFVTVITRVGEARLP
jgi:type III secretory pathway component EscS